MLKAVYEVEADVPEALREHYQQRDGKFLLDVDGLKTQADIEKQLTANQRERTEHGATKQKVADLEAKLAALGTLGSGATVDDVQRAVGELAAAQTAAATAKFNADAATALRERDETLAENATLKKRISDREVALALKEAATKAKVLPGAVETLTKLGASEFKLGDDGRVVTEQGLDPAAWIETQKATSPFLWPASKGAGATGGGAANPGVPDAKDNPFSAAGWNLTAQGHLTQSNPARASQLATMAGTKVGGPRPKAA